MGLAFGDRPPTHDAVDVGLEVVAVERDADRRLVVERADPDRHLAGAELVGQRELVGGAGALALGRGDEFVGLIADARGLGRFEQRPRAQGIGVDALPGSPGFEAALDVGPVDVAPNHCSVEVVHHGRRRVVSGHGCR